MMKVLRDFALSRDTQNAPMTSWPRKLMRSAIQPEMTVYRE
jgi:hypothetical protein